MATVGDKTYSIRYGLELVLGLPKHLQHIDQLPDHHLHP
jgi:hypothetical protein